MKKVKGILLATLLLAIGVGTPGVLSTPDGALIVRYQAIGRYDIVAGGVGLLEITSGDIILYIPGTVIQAYLYWAGFATTDLGAYDTLYLSRDGGSNNEVTAIDAYGPDPWIDEDHYHYVYVADVTHMILQGSHTYSISGLDIGYDYGAGLMVVYEDPALPYNNVKIYDGLDSFFFGFNPPQGPNSEVTCVEFDVASFDRDMDITLFVGGITHDDRPNAIWYQTGTGVLPTNLVHESGAIELDGPPYPYPLGAYDGSEWDTYTNTVTFPAGDHWTGVQVESVYSLPSGPNYKGMGASALFISAGFVLPLERAPGTRTPGYWKNHPEAWPIDEITIGGLTYTKDEAIEILNTPEKGDKTYTMFRDLVAAKLNVAIGNPSSSIQDTIIEADEWMLTYGPVGSGVRAKETAWRIGEPLHKMLDDYNNGL